MTATWDTGAVLFERDPRWRWRAWGYLVAGQVWPYRFEVRFKGTPCHHDETAATWDDEGGRFPAPGCDCWDALDAPPPMDVLPAGGLSARMLRDVRLGEAREGFARVASNAREFDLFGPEGLASAAVLRQNVDAALDAPPGQPFTERGPGRPALPNETHLRRLAVLADCYEQGKTQSAAARRLKVSEPTLRVSLDWARRHDLWTPAVNGRRGKPTAAGREAIEPFRGKTPPKGKR